MKFSNRHRTRWVAWLAVFVCLGWHGALANSVCVSCDGPPTVYSCSYGPNANGVRPDKGKRALQFACIQDVARTYQHASCSVKRHQLGACNGIVHMISRMPALPSGTTEDQAGSAAPTPLPTDAAKADRPREPKTVVELAKQTARDTQKQIDKSARSVSKAARSTWRCVSTLFQRC